MFSMQSKLLDPTAKLQRVNVNEYLSQVLANI